MLWDAQATRTLSVKTQRSKVDFNVFEGRSVKGQPTHTISRGALVYADGDLRAAAGHGQYVRRPPFGAQVGHDMSREYRVLSGVIRVWSKVPRPVAFCDDEGVLG